MAMTTILVVAAALLVAIATVPAEGYKGLSKDEKNQIADLRHEIAKAEDNME